MQIIVSIIIWNEQIRELEQTLSAVSAEREQLARSLQAVRSKASEQDVEISGLHAQAQKLVQTHANEVFFLFLLLCIPFEGLFGSQFLLTSLIN